jgi:hypothetical protein
MGEKSTSSGEVQVLVLKLLEENRADNKTLLAGQATLNANVGEVKAQLASGGERMTRIESRLEAVEKREPTPPPRRNDQRDIQTDVIRKPKLDPALLVKIGMLIGAIIAGFLASKAVP